MAREIINVGANKNDGTGDELRAAMQKVNANFLELYDRTGTDTATLVSIKNNTILTTGDLILSTNDFGNVIVSAPMNINGNLTTSYNIGINTTTPAYDLDVVGNIRVSHDTILGTSTATDSVILRAGIVNSILPKTDNTYDLGFDNLQFRNLHLGGSAFINAVNTPSLITTGGEINGTPIGKQVPSTAKFTNMQVIERINIGELILRNQNLENSEIDGDINLITVGAGRVRIPSKLTVGTGGSTMTNPVVQIVGNSPNFNQVGVQNINPGKFSCSDFVIQADNGGDAFNFGDVGINNSNWDGTLQYIFFDTLSSASTWEVGDTVYQVYLNDSSINAEGIIDESIEDPANPAQWRIRVSEVFTGFKGQFEESGIDYSNIYNPIKGNDAAALPLVTQTIDSTGATEYTLDIFVYSSDSIQVLVDSVVQVKNKDYYTHVDKVIFNTVPAIGATILIRYYNDANYPFTIGRKGDAYYYNNGGDMSIGTMSYGDVVFHTDGIRYTDEMARFTKKGNAVFGNYSTSDTGEKLQVYGNAKITGSVTTADMFINGNLLVYGTSTSVSSQDLIVEDAIINVHSQANLTPLNFDDGKDLGLVIHYYKTTDKQAFFGLDNATGVLKYLSVSSPSAGVYSGTYGSIEASTFISTATATAPFVVNSTVKVANLYVETANVANQAYTAQSVTDNAQPNITSLGTLIDFRIQSRTIPNSLGVNGDVPGMIAVDDEFIYHCTGTYDGVTSIWKRLSWGQAVW